LQLFELLLQISKELIDWLGRRGVSGWFGKRVKRTPELVS
jgi:hypothetical protein